MASTVQKESKVVYLQIGQNYEHLAENKQFDVSEWVEAYPDATIYILFRRPGEDVAAPVQTTLEDGILTWTISNWETGIIGVGFAEIRAIDSTTGLVKKSHVIPCSVEASVTDEDTAPDFPSWIDRMITMNEHLESVYSDFNQELADGIASIQDEAAEQKADAVEAIQDKGDAVIASIPMSYTDLIEALAGATYNPNRHYEHDEFVWYDNALWQRVTDSPSIVGPWNENDWTRAALTAHVTEALWQVESMQREIYNSIAPAWDYYDATASYAVGDYVINRERLYRCISPVSGGGDFDYSKWEVVTVAAELQNYVQSSVIASGYSASSTYTAGQYVWYSGNVYRCKTDISTAEAWTAAHWQLVKIGDELTDLKSAIDVWEEFPYSGYTVNERVSIATDTLGAFVAVNGYARTGLIPCVPGSVYYKGLSADTTRNCFYDANRQVVQSFGIFASRDHFDVPDGVAFFAISSTIANMQNLRLKSQSIVAIEGVAASAESIAENANEKVDEMRTVTTEEHTLWDMASSAGTKLNNATVVFIPLDFVVPAFSLAKITTSSSVAGSLEVLLFAKNSNDTLRYIRSITQDIVSGENVISFLTDEDTVIGFYSQNSGITYSASGATKTPIYKANYSGIGQETVITYLADQEWHFDLTYQIVRSRSTTDIVTVKQDGTGKYSDIVTAITQEPENTPIVVFPGIYDQDMTACLRKRIILIGTDRSTCIIRDTDGRYGHHALYISCGYFENLTIEEPYVNGTSQEIGADALGAYAVHIDTDEDYGIGKTTEFHHCNILSDFFPAVGLGMRKDAHYVFDNCTLVNGQIEGRGDYSDQGTLGALYFHDSNGEQGDQFVTLKNCVLKSKLKNAMCPYQVNREPQNNRVYCDFISNVLYSDVGHYTDTVWFRRDPFNPLTGIFSIGIGYGNSISTLNNNT